jgi:hypothetical protein
MLSFLKRLFGKRTEIKTKSKKEIEKLYQNGFYDKMVKIKPTVVDILQSSVQARDNDTILLFLFWEKEFGGKFWDYNQFKHLMLGNKLTFPDTITRTRRKLQAEHPELRGELYEIRKKAETKMTNQMTLSFD